MSAQEDDFIRTAKLDPNQVKHLHQTHQRSVKDFTLGAAGWHNFNDIKTMVGLQGSFLWTEELFNPSIITFTFDPNQIGFHGTYTQARAGIGFEQGEFYTVPNNPAIGWAMITLVPQGGGDPRTSVVMGMMTDDEWRISIMILNKLGQDGPTLPAYSAVRTG